MFLFLSKDPSDAGGVSESAGVGQTRAVGRLAGFEKKLSRLFSIDQVFGYSSEGGGPGVASQG